MKNHCKEFYLKWFYSIKPCNYSFSCGIKICHWTSGKSHYWWHDKSIKAYRHLYPIVSNATFTFSLSPDKTFNSFILDLFLVCAWPFKEFHSPDCILLCINFTCFMLEMNIIGDNSSTIIRNANQNVETISHPFTFFSLPYFAFLITFFFVIIVMNIGWL